MISYKNAKNESCLNDLLHHLIYLKHLSTVFCDNAIKNFNDVLHVELKINKDKFINFDRSIPRIDDFYFNNTSIDMKKYP